MPAQVGSHRRGVAAVAAADPDRPAVLDGQVVMNADEAAQLTAILTPELAIPHHYAFTSGWLGDRLVTKSDTNPGHFQDAAARLAPATTVQIVEPGTRVELWARMPR